MAELYKRYPIVCTIWAFLEVLLFAGVVFGWSSLVHILTEEGFYLDLCSNEGNATSTVQNNSSLEYTDYDIIHDVNVSVPDIVNSTSEIPRNLRQLGCPSQESQLNLWYSIAVSFSYLSFTGICHVIPIVGVRIIRIVFIIIYLCGTLCLGFATPEIPWLVLPGLCCIGIGGLVVVGTNLQVAELHPRMRSTIVATFTGLFDFSSIVKQLVRVAYENGIARLVSYISFGCVFTVIVSTSTLFFLPKKHMDECHLNELKKRMLENYTRNSSDATDGDTRDTVLDGTCRAHLETPADLLDGTVYADSPDALVDDDKDNARLDTPEVFPDDDTYNTNPDTPKTLPCSTDNTHPGTSEISIDATDNIRPHTPDDVLESTDSVRPDFPDTLIYDHYSMRPDSPVALVVDTDIAHADTSNYSVDSIDSMRAISSNTSVDDSDHAGTGIPEYVSDDTDSVHPVSPNTFVDGTNDTRPDIPADELYDTDIVRPVSSNTFVDDTSNTPSDIPVTVLDNPDRAPPDILNGTSCSLVESGAMVNSETSNPGLASSLLSLTYILHLFWLLVHTLRLVTFIGLVNVWLENIFHEEQKVGDMLAVFSYMTMGALFTSLLCGFIYDSMRRKFLASSHLKRIYLPVVLPMSLVIFYSITSTLMCLIKHDVSPYVAFIAFTFFRSSLWTVGLAFIGDAFPLGHFFVLLSPTQFVMGTAGLIQYPIFQWYGLYEGASNHVNLFLLVMQLTTIIHPVILYIRGSRDKADDKKKQFTNVSIIDRSSSS